MNGFWFQARSHQRRHTIDEHLPKPAPDPAVLDSGIVISTMAGGGAYRVVVYRPPGKIVLTRKTYLA